MPKHTKELFYVNALQINNGQVLRGIDYGQPFDCHRYDDGWHLLWRGVGDNCPMKGVRWANSLGIHCGNIENLAIACKGEFELLANYSIKIALPSVF